MKGLVYTAIFGGRDQLHSLLHKEDGIDYVAYLDRHYHDAKGWQQKVQPETEMGKNPRLRARFYKTMMPKLQDGLYDWCLWMDGSHMNKKPIKSLVEEKILNGFDVALHKHPARKCAYAEAKECARIGKDKKEKIDLALQRLKEMGYPKDAGLHATPTVFRLINDKTIAHAKDWWDFVHTVSIRDQVSFDALSLKHGLRVNTLPGHCYESESFRYFGGH